MFIACAARGVILNCELWASSPIYAEELPRVAAHDSLLVLLRQGFAVLSRERAWNYPT